MIKDLLILTIFPGAMAFAAVTDLFTMTVPNRIAIALVAGFMLLAPLVGLGLGDISLHIGLALAALAVTFAFFSLGWIGGGDAKLFDATASGSNQVRACPMPSMPRCSAACSLCC